MTRSISCFGLKSIGSFLALFCLGQIFLCHQGVAQQAEKAEASVAAKLPLKRVVLFNSGVGFYQHRGPITGDASVELKFNVDDVNDLLKSMVLEDLGGGQISTVTYGSRDPLAKTLRTFAIDLTHSPTLGQLLSQIRGERVEIDAPMKIAGTIIGVETKKQFVSVGADKKASAVEKEFLTLLTDEGLRRFALETVGRVKLTNDQLDAELRQALAVLAMGHATDKKTVTLQFLGEGKRDVRVGYIQESPLWKTSYRLVLDDKDKPFLQGWAIVENTTDTDWKNLRLSLVSGRPISFVMDLYSPLYANRPVVVPELYAALRPQKYGQDLDGKFSGQGGGGNRRRGRKGRGGGQFGGGGGMGGGGGGFGGGGGGGFLESESSSSDDFSRSSMQQSAPAAAYSAEVGELFQYDIKMPVTLARQRSAMLPIINESVKGEKLSIYNAKVHAKHPLNGIRLKNVSKTHLMQGPMTVFDGGIYAGDAQIPDLPPGSERLLSYALDLNVEVVSRSSGPPTHMMSARIEKGVLITSYKHLRRQSYVIKNSGQNSKTVLVEHATSPAWKLIAPEQPTEKTRDQYRFTVTVEPDKPTKLEVREERVSQQRIAINSRRRGMNFHIYFSSKVISKEIKESLREVIRRQTELAELQASKRTLEKAIAIVGKEQARIRQNMNSIAQNTDLYNRYVLKFTKQEDQIEQHRVDIGKLDEQISTAQRSLEKYISGLNLP